MHKDCILIMITITLYSVISSLSKFRRFLKTEKHLSITQKKDRSKMINFEESLYLWNLQNLDSWLLMKSIEWFL